MDINRLDLNLLRVLLTVGQEGSVSGAAERLGLSQPAVSNAIGRLRTLTGDPMFVRGQGGMQMTDYAREIFKSVEIALASVESAMRERTQFDPAVARNTFTILMSSMGQAVSLPLLLRHAQKHAPAVRFNVMPLSRSTHLRQLETTEADLICGYVSRPKECLRSFKLFNTAFVCLFREDHPLIDDEITPELYAELEHVTVKREGEVGPAAELLGSLGLENRVKLSVSQVTAIPPILAATDLVLTTTRGFAETYTRMGGLRWLPLPYTIEPVKIGIYWHEKKQSDIANKWLRSFMRDSILKGYDG
ncbi:MAG: LysR family transcriptional regulator [Telluria sp.]|nr:LysR family transcriptional regulator [Telluria sp.]